VDLLLVLVYSLEFSSKYALERHGPHHKIKLLATNVCQYKGVIEDKLVIAKPCN